MVKGDFDSLLPCESVVVVAEGADAEVGFKIGDEEGFFAPLALDEVGVGGGGFWQRVENTSLRFGGEY